MGCLMPFASAASPNGGAILPAMQDISSWPGDRGLLLSQLRALAEIAVRAMRERTGLVDASVRDIEWDGEPLS